MLKLGFLSKFTCIVNFTKTPTLKKTQGANGLPRAIEQDESVCISDSPIMVKNPKDKSEEVIAFSLSKVTVPIASI